MVHDRNGIPGIIKIKSGGEFFMYDGIITENILNISGGIEPFWDSLISVSGGSFEMRGGIISSNQGRLNITSIVHIDGYGSLYSRGGSISSNHGFASVNIADGYFYHTLGIIYGNEESGVPAELANVGRTLNFLPSHQNNRSDHLPHIDGYEQYTYYSIPWPLPGSAD